MQLLEMYPVPFSQRLYIRAENVEKPYRLMMVNMFGQVVFEAGDLWQERASLQRSGWPPGLYWVVIQDVKGRRYAGKVAAE
ncbi:MAG: T9SS type A sorting domain-containing protein [Lewinellaceae bacterium]|nr:T9SS type A sorting domain-containing protein [Lewinellaceae bacterium]